jgi:hypothetical protein
MAATRNIINAEMAGNRPEIRRALKKSLELIKSGMSEGGATCYAGSAEWRSEVEGLIDHLHKEVFYMSEPRGGDPADHKVLRELRRGLHDLYVQQANCG